MENIPIRSFSCKDEELPVICGYVAYNYRRDHLNFEAHSPMYNEDFIVGFEQEIEEVSELVDPKSETLLRQTITNRLHATMNGLLPSIDRLGDYVNKSKKELPVTLANFGITSLKRRIKALDAEGVADGLNTVLQNIENHKAILATKGLSDGHIQMMKDAKASVLADKQQQYEITSKRKRIVLDNIEKLNNLYAKMQDILSTGKSIYRYTDKSRLKDYTFTELNRKAKTSATKTESEQQ